jgi:hypothetical protein
MELCIPELLHRRKRDCPASGNPKKSKNVTIRGIGKIKGKDATPEPLPFRHSFDTGKHTNL